MNIIHYIDTRNEVYGFKPEGVDVRELTRTEFEALKNPPKTKEDIWEAIKTLRTEKLAGGIPVEHEGRVCWLNSDAESRTQQQVLLGLGNKMPDGIEWKTLANDFVPMTPELAVVLAAATVRHDNSIFASAEKHRLAMLELDDPTDYDFTTGWPQTYQDVLDEAAKREAESALVNIQLSNAVLPDQIDAQPSASSDHRIDALQNDMAEMKVILAKLAAKLD